LADPQPQLPLFFREVAALDAKRHAGLCLERGKHYGFARETNAVPIAIAEAAAAAADYPLVFGGPGQPAMVAIVGYRDRENLFVDAAGAWRRDTYIPAYVRNYPFAVIEGTGQNNWMLGFDPNAAQLGKTGAALFAEGQPTQALNEAANLCRALYQSLRETMSLCAALDAHGLLVDNSAVLEFKQGGSAIVRGFRVIDQAKFNALDDGVFVDWRRRGWLTPIYAAINSAPRWARLVDLAAMARA
jgi:hypothetical protein